MQTPIVSKNISTPFVKFVETSMKSAKKALKSNPHFGEDMKGFKALLVNSAAKCLDELEKFDHDTYATKEELKSLEDKNREKKRTSLN